MMQAKYSPENKGHFGLASTHYCHFTSPIRRYPDLMVHRELKKALGLASPHAHAAPEEVSAACEHCSERERAASDAEREMAKVYQARLMSRHLGREFKGKISGMIDAGIFVEIERPMCEGLVPAAKLPGYEYHPKLHSALVRSPRMELHLGDQVMIEVESVNLEHREVNFRLLGVLESAFTRPARSLLPEPKKARAPRPKQKEKRRRR
jgi:ribonuclease R